MQQSLAHIICVGPGHMGDRICCCQGQHNQQAQLVSGRTGTAPDITIDITAASPPPLCHQESSFGPPAQEVSEHIQGDVEDDCAVSISPGDTDPNTACVYLAYQGIVPEIGYRSSAVQYITLALAGGVKSPGDLLLPVQATRPMLRVSQMTHTTARRVKALKALGSPTTTQTSTTRITILWVVASRT